MGDVASSELQTRATQVLIALFQQTVKQCAVQTTQRNTENRGVLAEWTYELVQVLFQVVAPLQRDLVHDKNVFIAMVHLIEWRYDSATTTTTMNSKNTQHQF